ncbi:DUF3870 domain-containing protein [uncultured Ilyobacter sp.]|jgi:hypothetical protein|uniref:DUF3870 domain-containing protein n=1 Tax=uncultured Ilyobacter sp. TaxID=544433 RepID=UPI0029BFD9C5|nr:DUF3870 domain-containing protein [uncultured Ilyobacter sp.]
MIITENFLRGVAMGNRVLVTGYSKIPGGISASDIYSVIGVSMEVDVETGEIIKADCSLVTKLAREFVKRILEGEKLTDIGGLEHKFKNDYHGSTRKALITATKICCDRYLKALENRKALETSK